MEFASVVGSPSSPIRAQIGRRERHPPGGIVLVEDPRLVGHPEASRQCHLRGRPGYASILEAAVVSVCGGRATQSVGPQEEIRHRGVDVGKSVCPELLCVLKGQLDRMVQTGLCGRLRLRARHRVASQQHLNLGVGGHGSRQTREDHQQEQRAQQRHTARRTDSDEGAWMSSGHGIDDAKYAPDGPRGQ